MKRFFFIALTAVILTASPPREIFDDFNYKNCDDPKLLSHGWKIIDGVNAPPSGAVYDKELISFETDPKRSSEQWMALGASVSGSEKNSRLSRIQSDLIYREGTYAARVFFDHALRKTRDGNIQTFYLITPLDHPNDSLYSECDFEYLPYDIWAPDNNKRSAVYASTWESYQPEPYVPDHAMTTQKQNLYGWHTLIILVMNGEVRYFIDKNNTPFAIHRYSEKGSTVYPESLMRIAFANWISVISDNNFEDRASSMKVDWFYHAPDTALGFFEILGRVNELRRQELRYTNNLE